MCPQPGRLASSNVNVEMNADPPNEDRPLQERDENAHQRRQQAQLIQGEIQQEDSGARTLDESELPLLCAWNCVSRH